MHLFEPAAPGPTVTGRVVVAQFSQDCSQVVLREAEECWQLSLDTA